MSNPVSISCPSLVCILAFSLLVYRQRTLRQSSLVMNVKTTFCTYWDRCLLIHIFFLAYCLAAHNYIRNIHGVPPLRTHRYLEKISQIWATHLAERIKGGIEHPPPNEYFSENIHHYIGSDRRCGVLNAIASWYVYLTIL